MGFLNNLLPKSKEKQDQRRMEAFMNAIPYEYCGWNATGLVSWSRDFPKLFGLASIHNIRDIQNAILPSDAAALEGMIFTLKKDKDPFTLNVKTHQDHRIITIHGVTGRDLDGIESYDILWAYDTTLDHHEKDDIQSDLDTARKDILKMDMILNALPLSVWSVDSEQKLQWCNDTYCALLDKEKSDLFNQDDTFSPILTDSQKLSVQEMAKKSIDSEDSDTTYGRMVLNGKRRLMDIHVSPLPRYNEAVCSAYDITPQDTLQAELKRYVSANAELLEQLSSAIAIFSADHKLEFYNQSFAGLWGLEDHWLNQHPTLGDILEKLRDMRRLPEQSNFPDYKKSWLDMFTSLIDQHQSMMHLPNGTAIRLMVAPHPMGGLMMTFEDVTSRLELESSYNTLIAVQRETLDNLGEGVAVYSSDARLRLYNPAYLKMWNLNPEDTDKNPHISELVEKKKPFFKQKKGKKTDWDAIKKHLSTHALQRVDSLEIITRCDDVILECRTVPLPDGGVMVTYRDITDTSRVQQALEDKNQALMDIEKLKTDFLANVSYQLRTPLNAISGFSEILNNEYFGEINDKQREYTQGITDAAARLAGLIDDILDLSSIEAGYLRLDKSMSNITDLLDDVYELTRDWAGMETLKIKYKKPSVPIALMNIDTKRLKQAIINIIRNAISYTPGGGTITLSLADSDNDIIIEIKDTGIGITEDDKDKIFEPFKAISRGEDGAKRPHTGLGLSLAKNIIAMHDGDIDVQSILGEGTTVTISIPK